MTIDEAIEILSEHAYGGSATFNKDFYDAERLGIEALRRVKDSRIQRLADFTKPLLGETEE